MGGCMGQGQHYRQPLRTLVIKSEQATIDISKLVSRCIQQQQFTENVQQISNGLSPQHIKFAQNVMKKHYLFSQYYDDQRINFFDIMSVCRSKISSYIFQQNTNGNLFFIIYQGVVDIQIDDQKRVTLNKGDSFGELALLYNNKRAGSAFSVTQCELIMVRSINFKKIIKQINLKDYEKLKLIVSKIQIFSGLNHKQKNTIIKNIVRVKYKNKQKVFQIGQPSNHFYIVQKGSVAIELPEKKIVYLKEQSSFGESCFYDEKKRGGSAYAHQDDTVLLIIDRKSVQICLGDNLMKINFFHIQKWSLIHSPLFSNLQAKKIQILNSIICIKRSVEKQILMPKGEHPCALIICLEGTINGKPKGTMFCDNYFGKKNQILTEDIQKDNPGFFGFILFKNLSKVLKQMSYRNYYGNMKINQYIQQQIIFKDQKKYEKKKQKVNIDLSNLQLVKKVKQNLYLQVYIVRNSLSENKLYILKVLSRSKIIKQSREDGIINERKIYEKLSFPSIPSYYCSFIDRNYIYQLFQYIPSCSLSKIMSEISRRDIRSIQYYTCTLIITLNYLHKQNIIYRNLKPQYIKINNEGRLFLMDFTCSKILNQNQGFRTFTIIGTPHYMAPQIFTGKGYSFQVDYWSLGILLYEMLFGKFPFGNEIIDPYEIYSQIIEKEITFPNFIINNDAQQLVKILLKKKPVDRNPTMNLKIFQKMKFTQKINSVNYFSQVSPTYIPQSSKGRAFNTKNIKCKNFLLEFRKQKTNGNSLLKQGQPYQRWNGYFL